MTNINLPAFRPVTTIRQVDFINLTPHPIVYRDQDDIDHTILPSGVIARIATISEVAFRYFGEFFKGSYPGAPEGIDGFAEWAATHSASTGQITLGIVSSMFLDSLSANDNPEHRSTECMLCAPLTDGTAIRNEKGHIVAVRSFRMTAFAVDQIRADGIWGRGD